MEKRGERREESERELLDALQPVIGMSSGVDDGDYAGAVREKIVDHGVWKTADQGAADVAGAVVGVGNGIAFGEALNVIKDRTDGGDEVVAQGGLGLVPLGGLGKVALGLGSEDEAHEGLLWIVAAKFGADVGDSGAPVEVGSGVSIGAGETGFNLGPEFISGRLVFDDLGFVKFVDDLEDEFFLLVLGKGPDLGEEIGRGAHGFIV